jgi:hypothetical protein
MPDRRPEGPPSPFRPRTDVPSPDGRLTAFLRNDNLWVREIATGKETQLTTDGVKDHGYATDNAGWTHEVLRVASYDNQANQLVAKNPKGKLLLAHGTMDNCVPPYNTLLVVNELIKANRDFDLLLLPNRGHGFGSEPYMVRRRWDYFVRNLIGAEPPREYEIKAQPGPRGGGPPVQ